MLEEINRKILVQFNVLSPTPKDAIARPGSWVERFQQKFRLYELAILFTRPISENLLHMETANYLQEIYVR